MDLCDGCAHANDAHLSRAHYYIRRMLCGIIMVLMCLTIVLLGVATLYYGPEPYFYDTSVMIEWSKQTPPSCGINDTITLPNSVLDMLGTDVYLMDVNSHTVKGSGILTLQQNLLWHSLYGFDIVAITDDNFVLNEEDLTEIASIAQGLDVVIVRGVTWPTTRINLILLGVDFDVFQITEPTDEDIQNMITQTHNVNGIVIASNLMLNLPNQPSHEKLIEWGVDYMEIVSDRSFDFKAWNLYLNNKVGGLCGTNMRYPSNVDCWTLISPIGGILSEEGILTAMRMRKVSINYHPFSTTPPPDSPRISETHTTGLILRSFGEMASSSTYGAMWCVFSFFMIVGSFFCFFYFFLHPTIWCRERICCWEVKKREVQCYCNLRDRCSARTCCPGAICGSDRVDNWCFRFCQPCYVRWCL